MSISIGELTAKISVNSKDFKAGLDLIRKEVKKLDRVAADAGRRLTLGLTLPIAALGAASIKASKDMDSLRRGMVAVTGSASKAAREMERLRVVAQLPGLGFADAVKGSTRLQAAGASAEQARRSLEAFGNAIATVGGGKAELDAVTLALTQILASGAVLGQEIRQLQQRIPQIRQAMIGAFGTARSEEIQKLGISADDFLSKITTELLRLPKVSGGVQNAFENLGDAFFRAGAALGDGLLPVVIPLVEALATGAEKIVLMDKATVQWAIALAAVAAALGPVLLGLSALATVVTAAAAALGLGLGTAFLAAGGVIAVLGLGAAALIAWGLAAIQAKGDTEQFTQTMESNSREIRKFIAQITADLAEAERALRLSGLTTGRLSPEQRAEIQERLDAARAIMDSFRAAPPPTQPVPPLIDNKELAISADMLGRLNDRAGDLVEKASELELAFRFEEDAEAARKLADAIGLVARELERVQADILAQRLGGVGITPPAVGGGGFIPNLGRRGPGGTGRIEEQFFDTLATFPRDIEESGDRLRDVARVAGRVASRLGGFGDVVGSVLGGIAQGGLLGLGTAAGSALASIIGSLFGGPNVLKQNTDAIRRNTAAINRGITGAPGGLVAAGIRGLTAGLPDFARGGRGVKSVEALTASLLAAGFTIDDFVKFLNGLGLELLASGEGFRQLREVLTSLFDTLSERSSLARRRIAGLDIDSPAAQFAEFQRALAQSLPQALGLDIARLTVDNIGDFVRGLFDQIAAETFDFGRLGKVSFDDFIDALLNMESLSDAAGAAADEINGLTGALRNAPAGFKVALSRFNASTGVASSSKASSIGNRFNVENLTVIANSPEEMLAGLESATRRQARRGGVSALDLSVTPAGPSAGL